MSQAFIRWRAIGVLCGAVLILGSAAGDAGAAGSPRISADMSLHGSRGYEISIASLGHGKVRLSATRGDFLSLLLGSGAIVSATYVVPGRVTRHRLSANLGRLGLVSVRFHRLGRPIHGHAPSFLRCEGRAPHRRTGQVRGHDPVPWRAGLHPCRAARRQGVGRAQVQAILPAPPSLRPRRPRPLGAPGGAEADPRHRAGRRRGARHGRLTALDTIRLEAPPKEKGGETRSLTLVAAARSERRSRIEISRTAAIIGDQGSLLASRPGAEPVTATVVLPGPFAGTGSYLEQAGHASSWTGPLRVRLPGADRVPLAGKAFTAAFCREEPLSKAERCLSALKEAGGSTGRASLALGRRLLAARR